MKAVRAMFKDRRSRQRGSVLSGVLIMTAFIAIISGALMTALSTNLLLSSNQMNKAATEATLNSALEMALNQIQTTDISKGCPNLTPAQVHLNARYAVPTFNSCWPVVDGHSPQYASLPTGSVSIEGTHSVIPNTSQDLYVVGDSSGTVYSYQFGQSSPIWSLKLGAAITGPPMAMQDAAGAAGVNADIVYLVPIAGGSSSCPGTACVELLGQDVPNAPDVFCYMPAAATVKSRPAAGQAFPQLAYFGDSGGTLSANNATELNLCSQVATAAIPGSPAIVAGPVVFSNGNRDEIYVVTSKGSTAQLVRYEFKQGPSTLSPAGTLTLPFPNPVGVAIENTSLPARLVITFAGGGLAIVAINSSANPSLTASAVVGSGFGGGPYWCACPTGPQIGVASQNGALYVLDTNLNLIASYAGGSPIQTAPAADGVGEWFFGAADGYLHELQLSPGQSTLVQVARYGGGLGSVGSSVQVSGCPAGICIYLGTSSSAYLVSLDARDAVISVCMSAAPPTCSGANPHLWAKLETGSAGSKQTVHVQGWSYYSP